MDRTFQLYPFFFLRNPLRGVVSAMPLHGRLAQQRVLGANASLIHPVAQEGKGLP